jgi:redoxin
VEEPGGGDHAKNARKGVGHGHATSGRPRTGVSVARGGWTDLQRDYQARGVQLVAINSNDDKNYPQDSFEEMVKRHKAKGYNFPYLRDGSQQVAKTYGATHTPHLFVFNQDRRLAYTGKIDDNWQNPGAVQRRYLREALDALLKGATPAKAQTHAIGCTIKWA